jgi:predicted transcriptional regulator
MGHTADYDAAARVIERLADAVEEAAAERDLSPAEVAQQAGIPVTSVLALHDGRDIALRSAAALLRWLARPIPPGVTL